MSERSVAARYAKSILDLAVERGVLEQVNGDMQLIYHTCKASSQLIALLRNPIVPLGKKLSIIKALFDGKVSPLTLGFMEIMIRKERADVLYPASVEFLRQYDLNKKVSTAEITTAVELTQELENEIMAKVKAMVSGEIHIKRTVNPDIIGGFILKVGDRQYDSSLRRSLNDLEKDLINKNFIRTI